MRCKRIETMLTLIGLSLFLLWILIVPLRVWAASAVEPLVRIAVPLPQVTTTPTLTTTLTLTLPEATGTPTASPSATATLTPTPTMSVTPSPTLTASVTPTTSVPPTEALPSPSPTPAATITGFRKWLTDNPLWFAGIMVGVFSLLFLGLLAVILSRRKRRRPRRTGTRPITPLKPAAPPAAPSPARLVYTDTEGKAQAFVLSPDGVTIGRATDNQLVIGATFPGWETVSQHHARIFRKGNDWIVTDLGSHNGIYVNERRTGRNLLRDSWKLNLGGVTFTFHAGKGA